MKVLKFLIFAFLFGINFSNSQTKTTKEESSYFEILTDKVKSFYSNDETKTKESPKQEGSVTERLSIMLNYAKTFIGTPYVFGGTSHRGIDCSSFVQKAFSALGIELPRVSASQANQGNKVSLSDVRAGDLLFFSRGGGRISHVAIVDHINELGEIFFIHSASSKGVVIGSLNDKYWSSKFKKAVRILE